MSGVIAAEWLKVRKRRMTWILLGLVPAVLAVLYGLMFLGLHSASDPEDTAEWTARLSLENSVTFGDAMVYRLVALFCVILAGSVTASEFGWRTIITFATWTGDRRALLIGKLVATGAACLAFIIAGWAAVVCSVIVGNVASGTFESTAAGELAMGLARGVVVTFAGAMVYGVLAAALAVWTRSAAAAIAVPLGVLLLEPLGAATLLALGGLGEVAANFTISHNIDGLLTTNGEIAGVGEDLARYPSAWQGALFVLTFSGVTAWLAARTLARRDIRE